MQYRREIDGLRAFAVLPVILFHAGFETFSGGFVGVDVFFVISGYLITAVILTDIEKGKFSIINFYERRARRILPALFLVMTISVPFGWLLLTPIDYKDFSESLVATTLFGSNIFLEPGIGGAILFVVSFYPGFFLEDRKALFVCWDCNFACMQSRDVAMVYAFKPVSSLLSLAHSWLGVAHWCTRCNLFG